MLEISPDHILGQNLQRGYLLDQIRHILQKIFPQEVPFSRASIVKFSSSETPPFPLSIYLLCPYRPDAGKFFYEMVSSWLIPGRKINIEMFFVTDFKFYAVEKEVYTIGEAVVRIKDDCDYKIIEETMEAFQRETSLGLCSPYHASRILEIKGVSLDEKTALIQEKIVQLLARFPHQIDYDIFSFMQQFVISSSRKFKQCRSYRYLTKVVCTLYIYFQSVKEAVDQIETKRYLHCKTVKGKIETPFGEKSVVGLFVALNFLHRYEVFEKSHVLKAIQRYVKGVKIVDDSSFFYQPPGDKILTFYMEIEKESGENFEAEEVTLLQKHLKNHLSHCIEQLVRPLFIPRNEEEVMKYIVTLSKQVQYIKDLPQVVISFEGQLDGEMSFTVVLVRPVIASTKGVEQLLKTYQGEVKFDLERVKKIGFIRRKYPKEAIVFRVRIQEKGFLREDHSLNLYKGRQRVVKEVEQLFGEIRDFNGGLLAKQMEVYIALKEALREEGVAFAELLENFFHSLYPVELKGIFPLSALVKFYLMFHEALCHDDLPKLLTQKDDHNLFIMAVLKEPHVKKAIVKRVEEFKIPASHLIKFQMVHEGKEYLGYVFLSSSPIEIDIFLKAIRPLII
jgi:hypothetical protein